jgi:hypothetical protein
MSIPITSAPIARLQPPVAAGGASATVAMELAHPLRFRESRKSQRRSLAPSPRMPLC